MTVAMLTIVASLAALKASGTVAHHAGARSACVGARSWLVAGSLIGRNVTIKGPVVETYFAASSTGSPTFLDIGRSYPDAHRVQVVIWIESRATFGRPEVRYRGRTICVRGLVSSYDGVLEIIADSRSQIAIAP
ncbi:MAG TPA: hypothetical protein VH063_12270 [Gaiellaceae bacterium]|nr:hypothetical protein [Gaiellaceae bacterium]